MMKFCRQQIGTIKYILIVVVGWGRSVQRNCVFRVTTTLTCIYAPNGRVATSKQCPFVCENRAFLGSAIPTIFTQAGEGSWRLKLRSYSQPIIVTPSTVNIVAVHLFSRVVLSSLIAGRGVLKSHKRDTDLIQSNVGGDVQQPHCLTHFASMLIVVLGLP